MQKGRSSGKKGNAILDTLSIVIILFVFTIIVLVGRVVLVDVNADIQADPDFDSDAKGVMSDLNTNYVSIFDNGIVVMYVFLWIFGVVASFFIDTHPVFLALTIVLMVLLVFVTATLANTYAEIAQDPDIQGETNFPKTTFIYKHLVEYFIVICGSIAIVLYGKPRQQ